MTETALITFFTPLKYSGTKVSFLVMSPTILILENGQFVAREVRNKNIKIQEDTNSQKLKTMHDYIPPKV